jgi:hypothetical protein
LMRILRDTCVKRKEAGEKAKRREGLTPHA